MRAPICSPGISSAICRRSETMSGPTATSTTEMTMLLLIIDGEAGRPHFLAEHIKRAVGDGHDVGNILIADHRLGEGPVDRDHLAFVKRDIELPGEKPGVRSRLHNPAQERPGASAVVSAQALQRSVKADRLHALNTPCGA